MIHTTPEGTEPKTGINFFPLNEWKYSRGFRIRTCKEVWYFRYSPMRKKFFIGPSRKWT